LRGNNVEIIVLNFAVSVVTIEL